MFINKYTTSFTALCPNTNERDDYKIVIETNQFWQVEDITEYLNAMATRKMYQEDLCEHLVRRLHTTKRSKYYDRNQVFEGKITMIGLHQGVEITSIRSNVS